MSRERTASGQYVSYATGVPEFDQFLRRQRRRAWEKARTIHQRYLRRMEEVVTEYAEPHIEDRGLPQPWFRDSRHRGTE